MHQDTREARIEKLRQRLKVLRQRRAQTGWHFVRSLISLTWHIPITLIILVFAILNKDPTNRKELWLGVKTGFTDIAEPLRAAREIWSTKHALASLEAIAGEAGLEPHGLSIVEPTPESGALSTASRETTSPQNAVEDA